MTAFLQAARQFFQDPPSSEPIPKPPQSDAPESPFSNGQAALRDVARIEANAAARQLEFLAAFEKGASHKPTPKGRGPSTAQSRIVKDLVDLINSAAGIRRSAADEIARIGRALSETAAAFPYALPDDDFSSDLQKLQRQARAARSSDPMPEVDEDDFIIVGGGPPAGADAIDALLIDEDPLPRAPEPALLDGERPLLDGGDDDGGAEEWPIMGVAPGASGRDVPIAKVTGGKDEDLDEYWDQLALSDDPQPVEPLSVLLEQTVEQELKKQEVGKVPTRGRASAEPSPTDEAWSSVQQVVSKDPPKRRRARQSEPPPRAPP